eukprot:m.263452 g.263452  ORF g.263452 m.263452 type:complete len:180 (+) comp26943_c0_seq1:1-540(+)
MPQQWEARMVAFDPNRRQWHNRTSAYRVYARYSYDGDNQRKHTYEEAIFDGTDNRFEVLELALEKKIYVTDIKNRNCSVYNMEHPFRRHDIPTNAVFAGYELIGSYPNQVELAQWMANTTYRSGPSHQFLTFEVSECAPVRDDHWNENTGFHYEEFSDLTVGLSNPNIFIPPTGCTPRE